MGTDRKWIIVRIDGKIASISTDYRQLAAITARLALTTAADTKAYKSIAERTDRICAETVSFEQVWNLRNTTSWDDLLLFGTDFQKRVWKRLWDLDRRNLVSYTSFAELCENRAGVRAVAHAIGLNPVAIIIPCHLVVPKEAIDKIADIKKKAEATIFKGDDLCMESLLKDTSIDFGEYSLGNALKRRLIQMETGDTKIARLSM
jgi:O-6-methylguanine DNA methyltransferase